MKQTCLVRREKSEKVCRLYRMTTTVVATVYSGVSTGRRSDDRVRCV